MNHLVNKSVYVQSSPDRTNLRQNGATVFLVRPRYIVLDSSTLGQVARDYWSTEPALREKSRKFIECLRDQPVYVTFTLTHVLEVLRHENESVVRGRLKFLRSLPFIAWLRPYKRDWFPGSSVDLVRRELHAVVHETKQSWREIVEHVGEDLLETGVGSEMFVEDDRFWNRMRIEAQRQLQHDQYVASLARTDPDNYMDLTLAELKQMSNRPIERRAEYMRYFSARLKDQLKAHGDPRLTDAGNIANEFAKEVLEEVEQIDSEGGDPVQRVFERRGVPKELLTDDMTLGDMGQLAVYVKQLQIFSRNLRPNATVSIANVPPDTLPSCVLERMLARAQRQALRVSGSDLGDGHIAPIILYADGVQVDKRTFDNLTKLRRACPKLGELMGHFFKSQDYSDIPVRCIKTK